MAQFLSFTGRTSRGRKINEIVRRHVHDLGGDAKVSEAQRALISNVALLSLQTCDLLAAASRGQPISTDDMIRANSALTRAMRLAGLVADGNVTRKSAPADRSEDGGLAAHFARPPAAAVAP